MLKVYLNCLFVLVSVQVNFMFSKKYTKIFYLFPFLNSSLPLYKALSWSLFSLSTLKIFSLSYLLLFQLTLCCPPNCSFYVGDRSFLSSKILLVFGVLLFHYQCICMQIYGLLWAYWKSWNLSCYASFYTVYSSIFLPFVSVLNFILCVFDPFMVPQCPSLSCIFHLFFAPQCTL